MQKEVNIIHSQFLNKEINVCVYGHYGVSIILFPPSDDSYLQNEECGIMESFAPFVNSGKCKIYAVDTVNSETWGNHEISFEERSKRHLEYNNFITEELITFIFNNNGGAIPVITAGAFVGAYHAVNKYFRRPDMFHGTIGLDGFYNIDWLTSGYFNDNCYFNSPIHYLPNLTENYWLSFLKAKKHVYLLSSSKNPAFPDQTYQLSSILKDKGINHYIDIWGNEWDAQPDTWNAMIKFLLKNKF